MVKLAIVWRARLLRELLGLIGEKFPTGTSVTEAMEENDCAFGRLLERVDANGRHAGW